jgi:hypothetical protein
LTSGRHIVQVRFREEGRLDFQVTGAEPLSFKSALSAAVPLPISVSDVDGDSVRVFYRFESDEAWSHARVADGAWAVPAEEFVNRWDEGTGDIELLCRSLLGKRSEAYQ